MFTIPHYIRLAIYPQSSAINFTIKLYLIFLYNKTFFMWKGLKFPESKHHISPSKLHGSEWNLIRRFTATRSNRSKKKFAKRWSKTPKSKITEKYTRKSHKKKNTREHKIEHEFDVSITPRGPASQFWAQTKLKWQKGHIKEPSSLLLSTPTNHSHK